MNFACRTPKLPSFMAFAMSIAMSIAIASGAAAQAPLTCAVETVNGQAEAVTGADRRVLAPEDTVALQDRIETADVGLVTLLCPDDLRITVGPSSIVVLVDVNQDAAGWGAMLPKGIARFARPLFGGARFEVRTPSAVASVRSTVWTVEVELGATAVFVGEGQVEVAAGTDTVLLDPGQGVDVTSSGAMGQALSWSAARVAAQEQRLESPVE